MTNFSCPYCGMTDSDDRVLIVENFYDGKALPANRYQVCSNCGSMYRCDNQSSYVYSDEYYSVNLDSAPSLRSHAKNAAKRIIFIFSRLLGRNLFPGVGGTYLRVFRELNISRTKKILDVGSGAGEFLLELSRAGYKNLKGIEPALSGDVNDSGFKLRKGFVSDETDRYDVVLCHHVIEHVNTPSAFLQDLVSCVADNGVLLLCCPLNASVTNIYKQHSFLIQAPQHEALPSLAGIRYLLLQNKQISVVNEFICDASDLSWAALSEAWRSGQCLQKVADLQEQYFTKAREEISVEKRESREYVGSNYIVVLRKSGG